MSLPIITLISFLAAFLRDLLLARQLGASYLSDSLWLALLLPAVFENIVGIPLRDSIIARAFSGKINHPLTKLVLAPFLLVGLIVVFPLWLFRSNVIMLIAPGWPDAHMVLAIGGFSIGLMFFPLHAAYYSQTALASVIDRFAWAHARSVLINVGAICGCLIWPNSVVSILLTMLSAALIHGLVLQYLIRNVSRTMEGTFDAEIDTSDSRCGWGGGTLLITLAYVALAQQACVLLERAYASSLAPGAITHISVAFRVATIPLAVGVGSLIVPLYAKLEKLGRSSSEEFWDVLQLMLKRTLLFIFPVTVVFLTCSREITHLLLVRGAFSEADGLITAGAISSYAIGLPSFCLILIVIRALLARRLLVPIVIGGGVALAAYLVSGSVFESQLSVASLALMMSIAATVQLLWLVVALANNLGWERIFRAWRWSEIVKLVIGYTLLFVLLRYWPNRTYVVLAAIGTTWGGLYGYLLWKHRSILNGESGRESMRNS